VVFGFLTVLSFWGGVLLALQGSPAMIWSAPMFFAGIWLRTRPGIAALVIGILAVAHFVTGSPVVVGDVMIFYALYCANVHGTTRTGRLSLAAAFLGCAMQSLWASVLSMAMANDLLVTLAAFVAYFFLGSLVVLGTWALARYGRVRVDQLRLAREQVEQAVREREQRAQLAVADERARIAREMHDVVAHSLSVIIAQADGGRFIAARSPEKAADVLTTIGATGRSALADMRSLLGVLRQEERTSFGPQPGFDSLEDLLTQVRAAGLTVDLDRSGDLSDLPQALGMTVFRIIQESLTNVMKHAGPGASAHIGLTRTSAELRLDVQDDGRGHDPHSDGAGHGQTGMGERVALFGGSLNTGPLPAGGYRVSARIPLSPDGRTTR
jgi:signal transduction histidine kinase